MISGQQKKDFIDWAIIRISAGPLGNSLLPEYMGMTAGFGLLAMLNVII